MHKLIRVTVATAVVGTVALLFTAPAQAGNGSAVGAGLVGLGIGAILGSALTPQAVYVAHPHLTIITTPIMTTPITTPIMTTAIIMMAR